MSDALPEIGVEAAQARLDEFDIVDVREPAEFEGPLGHIAGAELIPLARVADAAGRLRDARPLLLVCRSGNRSGKACSRLAELGVASPTNLVGGMIAWNRAGLAVERERPAGPAELLTRLAEWLAVFAGMGEAGARERIGETLAGLDSSPTRAGPAELLALLTALEESLRSGDAPPDTDVVMQALRADAEALAARS